GEPYGAYLQRHLLQPLHMSATSLCECASTGARGYGLAEGRLVTPPPTAVDCAGADGGLCSSVPDLLTWQRAPGSGRHLPPASQQRMSSPGVLKDGRRTRYGYGLMIETL